MKVLAAATRSFDDYVEGCVYQIDLEKDARLVRLLEMGYFAERDMGGLVPISVVESVENVKVEAQRGGNNQNGATVRVGESVKVQPRNNQPGKVSSAAKDGPAG